MMVLLLFPDEAGNLNRTLLSNSQLSGEALSLSQDASEATAKELVKFDPSKGQCQSPLLRRLR